MIKKQQKKHKDKDATRIHQATTIRTKGLRHDPDIKRQKQTTTKIKQKQEQKQTKTKTKTKSKKQTIKKQKRNNEKAKIQR